MNDLGARESPRISLHDSGAGSLTAERFREYDDRYLRFPRKHDLLPDGSVRRVRAMPEHHARRVPPVGSSWTRGEALVSEGKLGHRRRVMRSVG